MKRSRNFYKYIYIPFVLTLLFVHFFVFVRTSNCRVLNIGFAFGIGESINPEYSLIISMVSILLVIFGIPFLTKYVHKNVLTGVLILSIGNFVDRIYGGVCDYIHPPKVLFFSVPVFNLLDLGIVLGVCLIFVNIMEDIWRK